MIWMLTACLSGPAAGQSGNEGLSMLRPCEVAERVPVDPATPSDGFDYAPGVLIEALGAGWTGDFDEPAVNVLSDARLDIDTVDAQPALLKYLRAGEEDARCLPRYEVVVPAQFAGGSGALDETFELTVTATAEFAGNTHALSGTGAVPLDQLAGSARPPWDVGEWTKTEVAFGMSLDETGSLYGSTMWVSTEPVDESRPGEPKVEAHIGGFSVSPE